MHKRRKTYAAVLLSTAMLSQAAMYGAYAEAAGTSTAQSAATAAAAATLDKLGSIALKSGVSVKLTDVGLFAQDGGNILTYTLSYYNGSGASVDLVDYFSKVTTAGGTVIKGAAVTASSNVKSVAAKTSQSVTYYVNVGKVNKVGGVKISMFGWDFASATDYQKKLGTFTVPSAYTGSVAKAASKKISMNNLTVGAKAESLQIYKSSGKVYAKVGISLTNLGSKVLSDPGFKAYLNSAGGSSFDLALDDSSSGYKVQPQEKKTVYYLAEIPNYMKTDNMTVQFAQTDSGLKLDLPVVTFSLPAATSPSLTVAAGAVKKLTIDTVTIDTQLKSANVYADGDTAKWTMQFRVKNTGSKSVTLPAYELAVKSSEGYTFPVDTKAFASLTLKPLEEKLIDLSVDLPLSIVQDKLQLQMTEPATANKIVFPAAYYTIPYTLQSNTLVATEYGVQNSYGTFGVKLDSVSRTPWGDGDQIAAKLTIRNAGTASVQLPSLTGVVKAGSSDFSSTAQVVAPSALTSLAPNATTDIYVLANVPYDYNFDKLQIALQSTVDGAASNFISLSTTQLDVPVATYTAGSTVEIGISGKKAEIQERRTLLYSGLDNNLLYTELTMSSKETRRTDQAKLVAYYKSEDGQFYEAEVSQSTEATNPGAKNLVTVVSDLPLGVSIANLTLYIGEAVSSGKMTALSGSPTGYIDTVGLAVNPTSTVSQSSLISVDIYPYTISVTNAIGTVTDGKDTFALTLNYNLSKNSELIGGTYGHKLVLEMVDPYGHSNEKVLTLGTDLPIGPYKTYTTTFTSSLYKSLVTGNFRINLYDQFKDQRMLLASSLYDLSYVPSVTTGTNSTDTSGSGTTGSTSGGTSSGSN